MGPALCGLAQNYSWNEHESFLEETLMTFIEHLGGTIFLKNSKHFLLFPWCW